MRNNLPNILTFVLLAAGLSVGWWYVDKTFFPKPPAPPPDPTDALRGLPREPVAALGGAAAVAAPPLTALRLYVAPPKPPEAPKEAPTPPLAPTSAEPHALIALGDDSFFLKVLLTNQGGGVQQVILTRFDDANRLGLEDKGPDGKPRHLHVIPGYLRPLGKYLTDEPEHIDLAANLTEADFRANKKPGPVAHAAKLARPSYTLFHYPAKDDPARPRDDAGKVRVEDDNYPLPTLGEQNWKVVEIRQPKPSGGTAEEPWVVAFETELGAPYFVKVRKTYSLVPTDYDFKLRVDVEALPGRKKEVGVFRYQLAGPVGMPIEGEWYTATYRTVYVGWRDAKGYHRRGVDDSATIHYQAGGTAWLKADNQFTYAAVGTQYFASALAIDRKTDDGKADPWAYVRPTREDLPTDTVEKLGQPYDPEKRFMYDVSFRAVANPLDLAPGEKVAHDYAVYNGPIKVRLLKQLTGEKAVAASVTDRYREQYTLETMTDFHSPTWIGRFANAIWWSDVVIAATNLMHGVLGWLHGLVGNWGLSIMLLTVLVRMCLILPSRRQQKITIDMQAKIAAIKPDLDRITEKYKDDFLRQQQEKAALMREAGVSHAGQMGGCLLLFAQMPIFMGLYFCLQESVFFRLQEFLWIPNLAAPDMLAWWGESIPLISSPGNRFGDFSFLYLGPYFNLLPIFAVTLFWVQQKLTMPPPTNDIEEQQRKMMKYMLIITALFFYKVAAGLCLYFIVSGLWTLAERKLIPKPQAKPLPTPGETPKTAAETAGEKPQGWLGRVQQGIQKRMEEMQQQAEGKRQIVNKPQAEGPPRPTAAERAQQRKNKKKRK